MKNLFILGGLLLFFAQCKKYKDPSPFTDSRLTNHYCNIPSAINYNWDFPGIPDNSVCVFPAQTFNGTYFVRDSFFTVNTNISGKDSFDLTFDDQDSTHLLISGFCTSNTISAHATRYLKFEIDTIVGNGQLLCISTDTINGGAYKNTLIDSVIHLNYTVNTIAGLVYHTGIATKK